MNAYEKRKLERQKYRAERQSIKQEHKFLEVDSILRRYEEIFLSLYNRPAKLKYDKGWVIIRNKKIRLSRLIEMTQQMEARLNELSLNTPEQSL